MLPFRFRSLWQQNKRNMKPIDWSKVKSGDRFTARIEGVKCKVKFTKREIVFICAKI